MSKWFGLSGYRSKLSWIGGFLVLAALFWTMTDNEKEQTPAEVSRQAPSPVTEITRTLASRKESPPEETAEPPQMKQPPASLALDEPPESSPPTSPHPPATHEPALVKDFWIWIGAGVNYSTYSQTVPGFSSVSFGRIKGPSQMAHAGFLLSPEYGVDLGYKSTPGEATAGTTISVAGGAYNWKTMSAEMLYQPKNTWLWRLGIQQHQLPFIIPLAANSIEVRESNLTAASVGVEYRKLTRGNVRVEATLKYQYPISSSANVGTSFHLKPKLTFDGSLGAAYEVRKNYFLGVYWYGQYHSYAFDYRTSSGGSFSGSQNLFFSNLELRMGVEF